MSKIAANSFVIQLDLKMSDKLRKGLIEQEFEMTIPPHTLFSGKKSGVSCTLYQSGKLVVQGKNKDPFIEFFLEPEILKAFTYKQNIFDPTARIGIDESGKGDFFGPLCIAGVFAEGDAIGQLKELGVKDSKAMNDEAIRSVAKKIRSAYKHHVVKINPEKYNEIYMQFRNLNNLLAWGHATTIESLAATSGCCNVMIDQFAAEHVVITALKRKKLEITLTQRHRAEEDLVVAAASILAREAFVVGLEQLGREYDVVLPKGASSKTIAVGKMLVNKHGQDVLKRLGKLHFKTLDAILAG